MMHFFPTDSSSSSTHALQELPHDTSGSFAEAESLDYTVVRRDPANEIEHPTRLISRGLFISLAAYLPEYTHADCLVIGIAFVVCLGMSADDDAKLPSDCCVCGAAVASFLDEDREDGDRGASPSVCVG